MTQLAWDEATKRLFETGVDHGVLYPIDTSLGTYPMGYAWNGLTGITESPSGAEANAQYADNIKYVNIRSAEQFGATIEAFTYPDEFGECDGSKEPVVGLVFGQQDRKAFGLAYRTVLGNDAEGTGYGYKLHLVYGATAAPSEKSFSTINESPEGVAFSWEVSTVPIPVTGYKPVSSITIDSTRVDATKLAALEAILYGSVGGDPRLPLPLEVISLLELAAPSAVSVSIAPTDGLPGVAVTANVVLTFNNAITRESVVIATAAGVLVAVDRSWDTDHKVLTLNPSSNLAGGTTYIVSIAGVVDIYNQSLATSVTDFATT